MFQKTNELRENADLLSETYVTDFIGLIRQEEQKKKGGPRYEGDSHDVDENKGPKNRIRETPEMLLKNKMVSRYPGICQIIKALSRKSGVILDTPVMLLKNKPVSRYPVI